MVRLPNKPTKAGQMANINDGFIMRNGINFSQNIRQITQKATSNSDVALFIGKCFGTLVGLYTIIYVM